MKGAIAKAQELCAAQQDAWIPMQFDNPSNFKIHYKTTGPEIWKQTDGQADILIAGVGTGGTVSGAGQYLKEQKSGFKVIAVEPAASPVLSGGKPGAPVDWQASTAAPQDPGHRPGFCRRQLQSRRCR